jgi:hypothetical protein
MELKIIDIPGLHSKVKSAVFRIDFTRSYKIYLLWYKVQQGLINGLHLYTIRNVPIDFFFLF